LKVFIFFKKIRSRLKFSSAMLLVRAKAPGKYCDATVPTLKGVEAALLPDSGFLLTPGG
jgi:hypothetical protein